MKKIILTAAAVSMILPSAVYSKTVSADTVEPAVYTAEVIPNNYLTDISVVGLSDTESAKLINDKYENTGKTDYMIELSDNLSGCKKAIIEFDITVTDGAAFIQLMNSSGNFGENLVFDAVDRRVYIDLGGKRYIALTTEGNSSSVSSTDKLENVDFPPEMPIHIVWEIPIDETGTCTKDKSKVSVTFDDTTYSANFTGRLAENGKSLQYIEAWSRSQLSNNASADTTVESYAEIGGFSFKTEGGANVFTGEHDSSAMAFKAGLSTEEARQAKIKWTLNTQNSTKYLTVDYGSLTIVGDITVGIIIDGLNDENAVVTAQWDE